LYKVCTGIQRKVIHFHYCSCTYVAGLQHLSDSVPDLPLLKRQERPESRTPDDEEEEVEEEQWLRHRAPHHEQRLSCECSYSVLMWYVGLSHSAGTFLRSATEVTLFIQQEALGRTNSPTFHT